MPPLRFGAQEVPPLRLCAQEDFPLRCGTQENIQTPMTSRRCLRDVAPCRLSLDAKRSRTAGRTARDLAGFGQVG